MTRKIGLDLDERDDGLLSRDENYTPSSQSFSPESEYREYEMMKKLGIAPEDMNPELQKIEQPTYETLIPKKEIEEVVDKDGDNLIEDAYTELYESDGNNDLTADETADRFSDTATMGGGEYFNRSENYELGVGKNINQQLREINPNAPTIAVSQKKGNSMYTNAAAAQATLEIEKDKEFVKQKEERSEEEKIEKENEKSLKEELLEIEDLENELEVELEEEKLSTDDLKDVLNLTDEDYDIIEGEDLSYLDDAPDIEWEFDPDIEPPADLFEEKYEADTRALEEELGFTGMTPEEGREFAEEFHQWFNSLTPEQLEELAPPELNEISDDDLNDLFE